MCPTLDDFFNFTPANFAGVYLMPFPLYPLNYGGVGVDSRDWVGLGG